jgi:NAD(P)-dependent dehydrogenase (short-subunit alcohol dehydrogenase family)
MNIDLKGRKALISGSTSGMGYAIARGLAEAGASVYLNGRCEVRVAAAIAQLRADVSQADVSGVAADIGNVAAIKVVFLASDQVSAITGAALHVDGGIIRSIL